MENVEITDSTYKLPKNFNAEDYFSTAYGVVVDSDAEAERIVIRANETHKPYVMSLPLHHSQQLIKDYSKYADFEMYLSPTYDFVMKLLQVGSMIEIIEPPTLRKDMNVWASELYEQYKHD